MKEYKTVDFEKFCEKLFLKCGYVWFKKRGPLGKEIKFRIEVFECGVVETLLRITLKDRVRNEENILKSIEEEKH